MFGIGGITKKLRNPYDEPEMDSPYEEPTIEDKIVNLMKPGEAYNKYQEHITSMPTMEENAPSTGRKIAAALLGGLTAFAGAGKRPGMGSAIAEKITTDPYRSKMDEWKSKEAPLKAAASLEEQNKQRDTSALQVQRQFKADEARQKQSEAQLDETKRYHTESLAEKEESRKERNALMAEAIAARKQASMDRVADKAQGDITKQEDHHHTEYTARTKKLDERLQSIRGAKNAANSTKSASQLVALMGMIHSIDDTAAREGEVNTQIAAQNYANKLESWTLKFGKGNTLLPPETMADIKEAIYTLENAAKEDKSKIQQGYLELSKRRGYNPRNIMLDYEGDDTIKGSNDNDLSAVEAAIKALKGKK